MRITNQMMTNNMLSHINQNKVNMSTLENQYSTGKKILKPSDDPIVAVRALKLRSNLTELSQYLEKNIPDAESWMDVTESAMDNVNGILTQMNKYCVQGSSDTLTADDRTNILQNLIQLKEQIYQEGNSQYAGRYVFTGYKTDTPLIYTSDTSYLNNTSLTTSFADATQNADGNYVIGLNALNQNMESISEIKVGNTNVDQIVTMTSTAFGQITADPNKVYYLEDTNQLVFGSNFNTAATSDVISITGQQFGGYRITENFTGDDIDLYKTVIVPEKDGDSYPSAQTIQASRLQLSYDNIYTKTTVDENGEEVITSSLKSISYTVGGVETDVQVTKTMNSTDAGAYEPGENDVIFLADTGELILGTSVAEKLEKATNIEVKYDKTSFATNELKPEHFFECSFVGADGKQIDYEQADQDIAYEVNFKQSLKVNTEAKDAITHNIDRLVDDITTAVNNVTAIEKEIASINEKLASTGLSSTDKADLEAKLEQLDTALSLNKSIMQETFAGAITATQGFEDTVNVAIADLGARSKRLELTKSRLEDQQVELEDLKSNNEDVDLVETVIRYKSAESIYTSSLSAAASVIKTNLLNFL